MIRILKKFIGFLCGLVFCTVIAVGVPQMARAAEITINETNFPDANFRNYVSSKFDKDNSNGLSEGEIADIKEIYVYSKSISSLKGIEHFTALKELYCYSNQLTSLDVSKNTALIFLYCDKNQLTSLDVNKNTALIGLSCDENQLTSLDVSKNTALTYLSCDFNKLTNLDVSKNTALTDLSCDSNKLTNLDVSKNTALKDLRCDENQLTSLDVSKNTALKDLRCDENQLTSLDVNKNTALIGLSCDENQLTSLDVSKNTALTYLSCDSNKLTNLDVSKNTALTDLYCAYNQLTNLDVSKNTALTILFCDKNQLTNLDLNKNTALKDLSCSENQLTNLDLSKNTALIYLVCSANQLTNLDLSKNTALIGLECYFDQLTNLNLSKNTALTGLYCAYNQLTNLDLSKNTALTHLCCYSNQLTNLDVSKNTALIDLECYSNKLTELKLNSQTYDKLSLYKRYLHGSVSLSDLQNITETATNNSDTVSKLKVTDITKPATYKVNGKDFTIIYVDNVITPTPSASPTVYDFNYDEDKSYQELAKMCSELSLLAYQAHIKDESGNWVCEKEYNKNNDKNSSKDWLGIELVKEGYEDLCSYNYKEKDVSSCITFTKKRSEDSEKVENSILYTIGHRRVKINGDIQDQIVIVFRGTTDAEWYGNFDITGKEYNSNIDYHWSFQQATNEAMGDLVNYIDQKKLDNSNLSILITGHSRGAAVSNLIAHELTDIRYDRTSGYANETYVGKFLDYNIKSVYAYTFATPNVATYNKIKNYGEYKNIFNYCFTDDFVPNLALENWGWGKYGQTYWATAEKLSKDKKFGKEVKYIIGKKPIFSEEYTDNIVSALIHGTYGHNFFGVEGYYNEKHKLNSKLNPQYSTLYKFARIGLGGTMQGNPQGIGLLLNGLSANSPILKKLSKNFISGGMYLLEPFHNSAALNTNHQCGTYYKAICYKFDEFKLNQLTDSGYSATRYGISDTNEYDKEQISALQAFLSTEIVNEIDNTRITYAESLGWLSDDPSTWAGVTWKNGSVVSIDISYANIIKKLNLDLTKFPSLLKIDCSYNSFTELDFSSCPNIEIIHCEGNQLYSLNLSGLNKLTEVVCSFNNLTELKLNGCTNLETLNCSNNTLTTIDLKNLTKLKDLDCDYNELDPTRGELAVKIEEMDSDQTSNVTYLPQNIISGASFSENDVNCLLEIANFKNNNDILVWNIDDPSSWNQVSWVMYQGTYYLESIDLTGLNLAGTANFTNCHHLNLIKISGNNFTNLCLDGCNALEMLLCRDNYLDEDQLEKIVARYNELSYVIKYQKTYSEFEYSDNHIFSDYNYNNPVTGSAVVIYGNGVTKTIDGKKLNNKVFTAYTDIAASYKYALNSRGIVKPSVGKVIVGITKSDTKPEVSTRNKITDTSASNIAKARIKNGQITVTAVGKEGGFVYLWVIDTGNKGVSACCPIDVKLAPKRLEVQSTAGSKLTKTKLENGKTLDICVAGLVGQTKAEDGTYTATVASKDQSYVTVTPVEGSTNKFTINAKGLKNNKDTKVTVTFKCDQNGKKTNLSLTITK